MNLSEEIRSNSVIVCYLKEDDTFAKQLYPLLSAEEKKKIGELPTEQEKQVQIISKGFLRKLISEIAGTHPDELSIAYGKYGKPFLLSEPGLQFSLSHSGGMIAATFCLDHTVGIDIEWRDRNIAPDKLVSMLFSENEADMYAELGPDLRNNFFFDCWTRKEAVLKTLGCGLSYPLHQFSAIGRENNLVLLPGYESIPVYYDCFELPGNYQGAVASTQKIPERKLIDVSDYFEK